MKSQSNQSDLDTSVN